MIKELFNKLFHRHKIANTERIEGKAVMAIVTCDCGEDMGARVTLITPELRSNNEVDVIMFTGNINHLHKETHVYDVESNKK